MSHMENMIAILEIKIWWGIRWKIVEDSYVNHTATRMSICLTVRTELGLHFEVTKVTSNHLKCFLNTRVTWNAFVLVWFHKHRYQWKNEGNWTLPDTNFYWFKDEPIPPSIDKMGSQSSCEKLKMMKTFECQRQM